MAGSVFVVVTFVCRVPVPVVDVVDMVAVRDRHMAASLTVHVIVGAVFGVTSRLALIEMTVVGAVQMAVVDVVDMVAVRDRDMAAFGAVYMRVTSVLDVCCGHQKPSSIPMDR